jgi:DNA polymerase III alpha subunit
MAAFLANWGGYYRQETYLLEARRLGLDVRGPHVNHSQRQFCIKTVDSKEILFMGLDQVRDLTKRTQKRILHERPFSSFVDFMTRTAPRVKEVENLVKVGGLEGLGTIPGLLNQLHSQNWRGGQLQLFDMIDHQKVPEWSVDQKVAAQVDLLGISATTHPLELKTNQIKTLGVLDTIEAKKHVGHTVRVAGMRQTLRRRKTSGGETIYFLELDDLTGNMNTMIPGEVYSRNRSTLTGRGPFVIEGTVTLERITDEPTLRAVRVIRLT